MDNRKYVDLHNVADISTPISATIDDYSIDKLSIFMETAELLSQLSHCVSRKVAALIVKNGRIISTGINGTLPHTINCDCIFDINTFDRDKHHKWSELNELHAESNAIAEAAKNGVCINGADMFVTLSPCINCTKLLVASGIKRVFFANVYDKYSNYTESITEMNRLFNQSGVELYQLISADSVN